jgi:NADH-quinone oxidoreductase subunit E
MPDPNTKLSPTLSEEQIKRFDHEMSELLPRYPSDRKQSAMLQALHLMQEMLGYLTTEAMLKVAQTLEVSPEKVGEVATFYSMLRLNPVGKYRIDVCTNLSCSLRGAEHVLERLESKLGIGLGETTADGRFSLREVECLASCGTAPCLQINEEFFENLTPGSLDQILSSLA